MMYLHRLLLLTVADSQIVMLLLMITILSALRDFRL